MGDWTIHIEGTGQHHNGKDEDADNLADKFVAELLNAGQRVKTASVTTGYRRTLPTNRRDTTATHPDLCEVCGGAQHDPLTSQAKDCFDALQNRTSSEQK